MPGVVKSMLQEIVEQKSQGSEVIRNTIRTKLILRGMNPDSFDDCPDDPVLINKVHSIAKDYGIQLSNRE